MAFTNTDFTEMFGCMGVVINCPLKGTTTPGTDSQIGFAPSIGIGPLIALVGIVTGWLTASGTCPSVSNAPTARAESRMANTNDLLAVCTTRIFLIPPLKRSKIEYVAKYRSSRQRRSFQPLCGSDRPSFGLI